MKPLVVIRHTEPQQLNRLIPEIFSTSGLKDLRHKKVFVKPNMLRPSRFEEGVVTSPTLISAVVSYLLDCGAEVVVGDNPASNSRYNAVEVAELCGFLDASKGRFRNIAQEIVRIENRTGLLKNVYVSKEIFDCDLLISLPKFKVHDLTTLSLAVKNHFGIVPGALKAYIHKLFVDIDRFSKVLLEIYRIRPPDLVIVDALNVFDSQKHRFVLNQLIAGNNGHAVDYACARIAGINPDDVPTIKIARVEKYFIPEEIEYIGRINLIKGFKRPYVFPFRKRVVESIGRLFYRIWLKQVPWIDERLCRFCDFCVDICPTNAIKNRMVDYERCIRCYCCIEVCPYQAIKKRRLWF